MNTQAPITAHGLSKAYRVYAKPQDRLKQMLFGRFRRYFTPFEALRGLDLTIARGETVGLIGRNGSGKSTLLQLICGTLQPTHGSLQVSGRISALLELGAGFNPEFSGRENVYLYAAILGLTRAQIDARFADIVSFSGLDDAHLAQPVKTYSSGMYVRLAFSVAISVEPDILIIDEALAVGDEGFQRRCFDRIKQLQAGGTTILFVSHSAQSIIELCDRAVLLDEGEKLCEGAPKDVISAYHRLLYAPREARGDIREALKHGEFSAADDAPEAADTGVGLNKDRVEYAPQGGSIRDVRLTDLDNQPAHTLQTGARYRFHYTVTLSEPAFSPKFGMLIKTQRGVQLGGAVAEHLSQQRVTLQAGEQRNLQFEFDCPLRPGHYFINCGCTKEVDGEDVFIHRIIDALEFKVIDPSPRPGLTPAGHIDLNVAVQGSE